MTNRLALVLLLLSTAACGAVPLLPASGGIALAPGEIALPTEAPVVLPSGVRELCAGIGLVDVVLKGDPRDPHVAWLVNSLGRRTDIVWPAGYRARFAPGLTVLAPDGTAVLRAGDPVAGGCDTGQPNVLLLVPTFH